MTIGTPPRLGIAIHARQPKLSANRTRGNAHVFSRPKPAEVKFGDGSNPKRSIPPRLFSLLSFLVAIPVAAILVTNWGRSPEPPVNTETPVNNVQTPKTPAPTAPLTGELKERLLQSLNEKMGMGGHTIDEAPAQTEVNGRQVRFSIVRYAHDKNTYNLETPWKQLYAAHRAGFAAYSSQDLSREKLTPEQAVQKALEQYLRQPGIDANAERMIGVFTNPHDDKATAVVIY